MNTPHQANARDSERLQASQQELAERIAQIVRLDGEVHPFTGIHLARLSTPMQKIYSVLEPSFCVIAQGSKEMILGDSRYRYDSFHYLLATLDLPRVSYVLEASQERPYLSFRLELDPLMVSSVMVEAGYAPTTRNTVDVRAITVSAFDANLLDAVVRLVRLVDTPEAPILKPMITREIIYRLLIGEQGARLRHLTLLGGTTSVIAKAVQRIRQDFNQPLRIEQLARELGMSVSGFHSHFKAATSMSPLQFQKQLRLQEARQLMLNQNFDATSAAYRVGYNDAAHFNREYKSLFGVPPMRDIQQMREA